MSLGPETFEMVYHPPISIAGLVQWNMSDIIPIGPPLYLKFLH